MSARNIKTDIRVSSFDRSLLNFNATILYVSLATPFVFKITLCAMILRTQLLLLPRPSVVARETNGSGNAYYRLFHAKEGKDGCVGVPFLGTEALQRLSPWTQRAERHVILRVDGRRGCAGDISRADSRVWFRGLQITRRKFNEGGENPVTFVTGVERKQRRHALRSFVIVVVAHGALR